MHDSPFHGLGRTLLAQGVAARTVRRTIAELEDHLTDLEQEALESGVTAEAAREFARQRIGDVETIAHEIASRGELRAWHYRYPKVARMVLPFAYVALLPAVPLFAGVTHAPTVVRWGASLMLGAAVTAAMFLILQVSIAFS